MELKLLTLNLHAWQEQEQEKKFEQIANFILENNIDIIAFQEVNQHKDKIILFENIREDNPSLIIKKYLENNGKNYEFVWDWSHYGFNVYEEGLSIMTKHRLIKTENRFISNSHDLNFWKTRKALKATIKIQDKEINVYSCHMGWLWDEVEPFKYQMSKLSDFVKEEKDTLSFIMGDFNNPDESEGYEIVKDYGLFDLFQKTKENLGFTIKGSIAGWETNEEGLRIDYIYSNQKTKILESKVVFEEKQVSDHFGVYIKVKI